jgi:hypothetical protein
MNPEEGGQWETKQISDRCYIKSGHKPVSSSQHTTSNKIIFLAKEPTLLSTTAESTIHSCSNSAVPSETAMPHYTVRRMASVVLLDTILTVQKRVTGVSSNRKIANHPKLAMLTRRSSRVTGGFSVAMRMSSSTS